MRPLIGLRVGVRFTCDERGKIRAIARVTRFKKMVYQAPGRWCADERLALASALRELATVVGYAR